MLYLYIGLLQRSFTVKLPRYILYGKSAVEPLLLIESAYAEYVTVHRSVMIQVGGIGNHLKTVELRHQSRIGIKEGAVALKIYHAAILHHLPVKSEKAGSGKTLCHLLHLRVGEGNPYLVNLVGREKVG